MVTAKTQYNLATAREYFEEHLCAADYYVEGQRISGEWLGHGAQQLGLSGRVHAEEFLRLCENQHPASGDQLTQRMNTVRVDGDGHAANRRVFYDFTFSPPKSVSLAAFLGQDERILEAHARAVRSAMHEFEAFASTRIRVGGQQQDRRTGNVAAALFTHDTSRALDPHLHTHCIVFNATFDPVERRWKALQNHDLLRARKFAENAYYHELSRELRHFGYRICNHPRGDFQLEGIPEDLCNRFSKRDAAIDRALAQLLSEKPELAGTSIPELRARLATTGRSRKQKDLRPDELQLLWDAQLSPAERTLLRGLKTNPGAGATPQATIPVTEAMQWAEEHLFDRRSVVLECQIWQEALSRARGSDFSLSDLKQATATRGYLRNPASPGEVTRREVLQRETEIVHIARQGIAECQPLVREPQPLSPSLDEEQRGALDALLRSTNRVTVFRGGAGTGKSFVLRELVQQIGQTTRPVVVLAPQRQQVVAMEAEGFPSPTTTAALLAKGELPERAVIVVDEAGQIGGRHMLALLKLAIQRHARVILSGDTRQHGAVDASDALLAIERHGGVKPVELRKIRRQDPERARDHEERTRIRQYRQAVEAAASGQLTEAFDRLDTMGAIVRTDAATQSEALATEYVRVLGRGDSAIVVAQTWSEVHRVNQQVREALKAQGALGPKDCPVQVLERMDLTNAQKRDARFHSPDSVIVFHRKVRGAPSGAKGKLTGILKNSLLVEVAGRIVIVSHQKLDHISVCRAREIPVATGERLQLKANRPLPSGGKATNGELVQVQHVRTNGDIVLADGRVLDAGYREFLPGYAVTSYGSQGKTVDHVLFSDSANKAATNAQQWYVTISRGRRGIRIFTPDKEQLRENISRSGHRPLALDVAAPVRRPRRLFLWDRLQLHMNRFGERAAAVFCALKRSRRFRRHPTQTIHEHQAPGMLDHRPERPSGPRRAIP